MVIIGANQKLISIPPTQELSKIAKYMPSSCLWLLGVVGWGNTPVFQKDEDARGIQGLLRFTQQQE